MVAEWVAMMAVTMAELTVEMTAAYWAAKRVVVKVGKLVENLV